MIQPDTIVPDPANPQDWNRYIYARNNPVRYTDPSGHRIEEGDGACSIPDWCRKNLLSYRVKKSDRSDFEKDALENLLTAGPEGINAVEYIFKKDVRIVFKKLLWGGGGWGLDGNITLQESYEKRGSDDPFLLGLIAHEAYHLEQKPGWALSKIGEIEAWKLGFTVQRNFSHQALNSTASAIADLDLGKAYYDPQAGIDLIHRYNNEIGDATYNFMFDRLPTNPLSWYFIY